MRARSVVLDGVNGGFAIEEAEVPDVEAGGALIKQQLCGICGTDAHLYRGHLPNVAFPLVLGHETVGTVEKLGAGLDADATGRPVSVGDFVAVAPGMSCRRCVYCTVYRQPTLCLARRGYGFRPRRDAAPHFQGGFADYLNLTANSTFFRIDASPEAAVVLEPLSIGVHQVDRIDLRLGSTVVIQGAGAIGLLTLAAARQAGATRTIVVGAPKTRLDLARAFGADVVIDLEEVPDAADRIAAARAETPGGFGADIVFECAGVPSAIVEGIEMMRRGGTFVEAGHYTDHGDISLNPFRHIVNKHGTLIGVWSADVPHFVGARAMIESGAFPFAELVSHTLPLERVGDGIGAIGTSYRLDGREIRKIVVAASA